MHAGSPFAIATRCLCRSGSTNCRLLTRSRCSCHKHTPKQNILDTRGPAAERAVVHDVLWGSRFLVHHGVCDTFCVGQIVLAGDAVHVNSPVGGQGMNDGILDAIALAAALDAALERGTSEPLERYNARQRRIASQVITLTNALTHVATMGARLRPIRNAILSAVSPFVRQRIAWQLSLLAYR